MRPARTLSLLFLLVLAFVSACAGGRHDTATPTIGEATTCSPVDDPRCANPIDALVLPQLERLGLEPRDASRHELCRRLAIDIFGRTPTDAERERCLGESTEAIVDAWLDTRDYALNERRHWATLLDYDATYVWPELVEDLDRLVGELAAEEIEYATFAGRVAMHPAFFARHPSTDWFRAIFDLFLGRSARPDEVEELAALELVWVQREFFDETRPEGFMLEYGFSSCACKQVGGCRSDALGKPVEFDFACNEQPVRLIGVTPGMKGDTTRWREPNGRKRIAPLARASKEQARRLGSFGDALAVRLDFYETAVDRELRRMLGWWQSSFNQPDTDLPRVRTALARQLRASGSIRELQRTILTSILYTMSSTRATTGSAPVWSSGPRKLLPVETWLDAAAMAVGRPLSRCDHRFVASSQLAMVQAYGMPAATSEKDALDYLTAARSMGGSCRMTRLERPSIGGLEAQRALAVRLCAEGESVLPPQFDPKRGAAGFEQASGHLVERILGRPSTVEERELLAADMRACMSRPDRGCAEPEQAVRWTCVRLLTSAEYATY